MQPVIDPTELNNPVDYPGLPEAIEAAGYAVTRVYPGGTWMADDPNAVQSFITSYNPVPFAQTRQIAQIKAQGLAACQAVFGTLDSFDKLDLEAQRWLSIVSTARAPTARYQHLINIYNAGVAGIAQVNAATTVSQVVAVVVTWP